MEAQDDRLRPSGPAGNFVRNGGGCNAQNISSEPWARRLAGKPLHLFGGGLTPRVSTRPASHRQFARALRCRTLRQEPSVRSIFYVGAPPQMDLWDYKPDLRLFMIRIFQIPCEARRLDGHEPPARHVFRCAIALGFTRQGKSGRWVSTCFHDR